ncbi:hypothetical protein EDD17DRAFT_1534408 [Pisolithus thermaeus]|nr:hypothetical protein EDD17DRAFT_1534408 [Pisolithus thermaeus]
MMQEPQTYCGNKTVCVMVEPAESQRDVNAVGMFGDMRGELSESEKAKEINRSMITKLESGISPPDERAIRLMSTVAALKEEVARTRAEVKKAVEEARRATTFFLPIHIAVLVDLARQKIIGLLEEQSWDDLRQRRFRTDALVCYIKQQLEQRKISCSLSDKSLDVVCNRNIASRSERTIPLRYMSQMQVREAIINTATWKHSRQILGELYSFVYEASVDAEEFTM